MKKVLSLLIGIVLIFNIALAKGEEILQAPIDDELISIAQNFINLKYMNPEDVIDFSTMRCSNDIRSYIEGFNQYWSAYLKYTNQRVASSYIVLDTTKLLYKDNTTVQIEIDYNVKDAIQPSSTPINELGNYCFTFSFTSGEWTLVNISSELPMWDLNTNWDQICEELKKYYSSDHKINDKAKNDMLQADTESRAITHYSYDHQKAQMYALTYTEAWGGYSNSSYNSNFLDFAASQVDCQNYASQSVWYGFDGINNSYYIETHFNPMTSSWWADSTDTGYGAWTSCSAFTNYVTNNMENDLYGPQGYDTNDTGGLQVGDLVYITYGHAMIITKIDDVDNDGVDFEDIYISAHTYNHKDRKLDLISGVSPSTVYFINMVRYKV